MIIKETVTIDECVFTHTYSDTYEIRKIGTDEIYDDAMDVLNYQYEETDIPLEDEDATEADYLAALAELGVSA